LILFVGYLTTLFELQRCEAECEWCVVKDLGEGYRVKFQGITSPLVYKTEEGHKYRCSNLLG